MRPRVKGGLLLLLTFLLGAAAGALGFGFYEARPGWWGPPRDRARIQQVILRRLIRELNLRPEQRQQVETILRETGQEFARVREEIGPRIREIRARSRDRIRALLDPDQQGRFENLMTQWERRADRWRGREREAGEGESTPR
jgi:Spy/CpxP family protein refolding chaperone